MNTNLAIFLTSVAGLAACTFALDPARPKRTAVAVREFNAAMPVGYLGVPLGTVVRVTGVAVDGDTTGFRADLGKTLLRINDVDGKKLEPPIDVEFGRASRDVHKPTAGERFDYYVHEYGHFDGEVEPPKELNIPKLPVASNGFHYQRYVTVHASNAIRK